MEGYGELSRSITIYFKADCARLLEGRNQGVMYVHNPMLRGFFRLDRTGGTGFLVINTVGEDVTQPEAVNVSDGLTDERTRELLRAAIGTDEIPIEVLHVAHWRAESNVATTMAAGRVFLAGDAAHVVPPNGGYGGNTGVQDALNLAWKLAAVIRGEAGEALLDTYDAERRPLARLTVEQAYTRYATRVVPERGMDDVEPFIDDLTMELGLVMRSSAVIPDRRRRGRRCAAPAPGPDSRPTGHPRAPRCARRRPVHARSLRSQLRASARPADSRRRTCRRVSMSTSSLPRSSPTPTASRRRGPRSCAPTASSGWRSHGAYTGGELHGALAAILARGPA